MKPLDPRSNSLFMSTFRGISKPARLCRQNTCLKVWPSAGPFLFLLHSQGGRHPKLVLSLANKQQHMQWWPYYGVTYAFLSSDTSTRNCWENRRIAWVDLFWRAILSLYIMSIPQQPVSVLVFRFTFKSLCHITSSTKFLLLPFGVKVIVFFQHCLF